MKLLKNSDVNSVVIHKLREIIRNESKEVKKYLGMNSTTINSDFPIRKRVDKLWVLMSSNCEVIGYISFHIQEDEVVFIKSFLVVSNYRRKGYGIQLFSNLIKKYEKVFCIVNQGNETMYKFLENVGLRGERRSDLFRKNFSGFPIHWSNYGDDDWYEN